MADPFKLRALKAVTAALKEITPDNGYTFDLSDYDPGDEANKSRVQRGRLWYGEDDGLPLLSILEGIDPGEEVAPPPLDTTSGEHDWDLLIQGWVDDDPKNPTDPAYALEAEVRMRLAVEQKRKTIDHDPNPFGLGTGKNCITKVTFGSGVCRPADDVSAKAWFWLRLRLRIFENSADPYA